jgi:hypothetical protein
MSSLALARAYTFSQQNILHLAALSSSETKFWPHYDFFKVEMLTDHLRERE